MQFMPKISAAKPRAHFNFGSHTATLLGDIESVGRVSYAWLLVVYDQQKKPCYIVSSEENTMAPIGGGSHFLCAFDEQGHSNMGASDEWADEEMFTGRALGLVYQKLPSLGEAVIPDETGEART